MSDGKTQRNGQDRQRINVHEAHEVREWVARFGVSAEQLEAAVHAVGDRASAVEQHLKDGR